ncbi:hypothetical protein BGW39_007192 [Mortierella sp. 14UC]|nr:hypothetical protein BGW39_007192 [Mortierella sp. 14UC]
MLLGGRKLLVFGGTSASGQANGNMYIFDTVAKAWTVGTTSVKPRTNMACASAGDYLIAWGGHEDEKSITASSEMLIYNFKTDTWTNQPKIVPPSVVNNSDTSSKSNVTVIGGGAAAAFVLVAAFIGTAVLRRHRRQQAAARRHPQDSKLDSTPSSPPSSPPPPPNKSESNASLIAKLQLDPTLPSAPHMSSEQPILALDSRSTIRRQNTPQGQTDITDPENQFGLEFYPLYGNQDPQELPPSSTLYTTSMSTKTLVSYPLPPKWLSRTQSTTQTPKTLYSSPQIYSQELEQLPWQQPISSPQYIEPLSPNPPSVRPTRSPDYARIQLEFPSPPAVRDPQKMESDNSVNPLDKIVLVQEKLEQDAERLQKEEQAELKRTRKRWEERMSGRP